LLVLGDFSGRRTAGRGEPLPMLHKRPIKEIGKPLNEKPVTLPRLMKELRLGLPLPRMLTNEASFDLEGTFEAHVLREDGSLRVWLVTTELRRATTAPPARKDESEPNEEEGPSSLRSGAIAIPVQAAQAELHCYDELEFTLVEGSDDTWEFKKAGRFCGWIEPETHKPGEPRVIFRITSAESLKLVLASAPLDGQKTNVTGRLTVTARGAQHVPLRGMQSFAPEQLSFATPELRRLLILRWLLAQVRTSVSANPVLRSALKEIMKDRTAITSLADALTQFDADVGHPFLIDPPVQDPHKPPAAAAPAKPPAAPATPATVPPPAE
jgi:hypothetical protein